MTDTATVYRLELPLPPSLNRLYRVAGRRLIKTAQADAYAWAVRGAMLEAGYGGPLEGRLAVTIYAHLSPRADLDNVLKSGLDGMQGVLFVDDRQIDELHVYRLPPARVRGLVVEVRAL